ncbi:MFS transporter [Niallia taxi]|nr:MFS transporter [Niallia taxi]MDE5052362.1 MFS transporter [Niallia taxi]
MYPCTYAMAGNVWPEGGRKAFNSIYVAQNAGVALGSAIGGVTASYSFTWIFISNTFTYVIFFFIALVSYKNIQVQPSMPNAAESRRKQKGSQLNPALYALAILGFGYLLCWICYVQWQATISTHTQELKIPLAQYSLLWAVNGGLIVFGQPLISLFTKKICPSVKIQMLIGMVIFIVSFLIAGQAETFAGFLAAMLILTIGEMLVWPAVPTIADKLAPKGKEGSFQGIINSSATGGRMIGPLLGGYLVDVNGIGLLVPVLVFLLLFGTIAAYFYDVPLKAGKVKVAKS